MRSQARSTLCSPKRRLDWQAEDAAHHEREIQKLQQQIHSLDSECLESQLLDLKIKLQNYKNRRPELPKPQRAQVSALLEPLCLMQSAQCLFSLVE
jgi:molecular chaperone GrpE (heat shock protein)